MTAVYVDIDAAMARDYSIVFPVAALLIMVILGLLLRSLMAPCISWGRSPSASGQRWARRPLPSRCSATSPASCSLFL